MPAFVLYPPKVYDKHFLIQGPGDLRLYVDYDDVDRQQVDVDAEAMVDILNDRWVN